MVVAVAYQAGMMHADGGHDESGGHPGRPSLSAGWFASGVGLDDGHQPPAEEGKIEHDDARQEPDVKQVGEQATALPGRGHHERDGHDRWQDHQAGEAVIAIVGLAETGHQERQEGSQGCPVVLSDGRCSAHSPSSCSEFRCGGRISPAKAGEYTGVRPDPGSGAFQATADGWLIVPAG